MSLEVSRIARELEKERNNKNKRKHTQKAHILGS